MQLSTASTATTKGASAVESGGQLHDTPGLRQLVRSTKLCQSKIGDLHFGVPRQHHVVALDITMNNVEILSTERFEGKAHSDIFLWSDIQYEVRGPATTLGTTTAAGWLC
jgi:hypothetical protein